MSGPRDRHWPALGGGICVEAVLEAGARALSTGAGGWRHVITHWAPSTKTMKITYMTVRGPIAVPTPGAVWRGRIFELARRGNSATKRAAIVRGSDGADGPSGSAAIIEANLSVAASPGNRASSAASCQGSTSSRASAERTLSSIPFLSSPIGANRKSLNSDPRKEAEAECVISTTEFRRLNRTPLTASEASCRAAREKLSARQSEKLPHEARPFDHIAVRNGAGRLGNYGDSARAISEQGEARALSVFCFNRLFCGRIYERPAGQHMHAGRKLRRIDFAAPMMCTTGTPCANR